MSVTLSAPPYSFIQMSSPTEPTDCAAGASLCLPVKGQLDLAFQLMAHVSGADKDWFEVAEEGSKQTIWGRICKECADINPDDPDIAHSFAFTGEWTKITEGSTDVWVGNISANLNGAVFNALKPGDCFHICFYHVTYAPEDPSATTAVNVSLLACTNTCFNKISDECYTSRFTYSCKENSFGFIYTGDDGVVNFTNTIRLPCYLNHLQMLSEEKTYTKSDGSKTKLYERIDEQYDLVIDFMPKQWHINLKVLLAHDTVNIDNKNETGSGYWPIVCNEKYEISWPDFPNTNAPAKTKVTRAQALSLINSNCG